MRHLRAHVGRCACALVCSLAVPSLALAAAPQPNSAKGTITSLNWSSFTIQTAGRQTGVIDALTLTADKITAADYPYVWGGGHAEAGVASTGDKGGPGANGRRLGFDCSGSVAAVLAGAGLWPAGSGVPSDNGVIAELLHEGLIARGPGQPPDEVTLYDDPGIHIFMNINGRFFGTSDGGGGGDRKGGPGWLYDGAADASARAYKRYHVLPSVLANKTSYGQYLTFQLGSASSLLTGFGVGDKVDVGYRPHAGEMVLRSVAYAGAKTATGTVISISPDGSTLTVETHPGKSILLSVGEPGLLDGVGVGDKVKLTYTKAAGTLTARAISVTASPQPAEATGTVTALAGDDSGFTIQTTAGQTLTFSTGADPGMLDGVSVGDQVDVTYVQVGSTLTAQELDDQTTDGGSGAGSSGSGAGGYWSGGGGVGGGSARS
jgi:hypothetical protein